MGQATSVVIAVCCCCRGGVFDFSEAALRGMEALVLRRAAEEQSKQHFFLPTRLVQLVQLAVLCTRAIAKTIPLPLDPKATGPLSPALNIAARPETLETQSVQSQWSADAAFLVLCVSACFECSPAGMTN